MSVSIIYIVWRRVAETNQKWVCVGARRRPIHRLGPPLSHRVSGETKSPVSDEFVDRSRERVPPGFGCRSPGTSRVGRRTNVQYGIDTLGIGAVWVWSCVLLSLFYGERKKTVVVFSWRGCLSLNFTVPIINWGENEVCRFAVKVGSTSWDNITNQD